MPSQTNVDISSLIAGLARELKAARLDYMLIGGQAVLLHGRPRSTEDIDITVAADTSRLGDVVEVCTQLKLAILTDDVESFVQQSLVLPAVDETTGIRVDFIFSSTRFEREAIERSEVVELNGEMILFASAEDLIILKLIAGRAIDLEDAASVVRRKASSLDWAHIDEWILRFSKIEGHETVTERLAKLWLRP